MSGLRRYVELLLGSGVIVALDYVTKEWVRTSLALGESIAPIPSVSGWLRITHWNNTGAAFGLFPAGAPVFTVIGFVVIGAIILYYPRLAASHGLLRPALILQLGGATGNLISRLTTGTVTDFVAISAFPLFNVADASITVGVSLLILSLWLEERHTNSEADPLQVGSDAAAQGWEDAGG